MQQTCCKTIKEVEHRAYYYKGKSELKICLEGKVCGNAARYEVAACDGVGNMLFHCYYGVTWFIKHYELTSLRKLARDA